MLVTCARCKKPVFVSASMLADGAVAVSCQSCGTGLEVSPDGAVHEPGGEAEPSVSDPPVSDNRPEEPSAASPPAPKVTPIASLRLQPLGVPPSPPPSFGSSAPVTLAPPTDMSALQEPVPPPPPAPSFGPPAMAGPPVVATPAAEELPPPRALPGNDPQEPSATEHAEITEHVSSSAEPSEIILQAHSTTAADVATTASPGEGWQAREPGAAHVQNPNSSWNNPTPATSDRPTPSGAWSEPARASVVERTPGLENSQEGSSFDPVPWSGPQPGTPAETSPEAPRRSRSSSRLSLIGGGLVLLAATIAAGIVVLPGGGGGADLEAAGPTALNTPTVESEPEEPTGLHGTGGDGEDLRAADEESGNEEGAVDFGTMESPDITLDAVSQESPKPTQEADARLANLNLEKRAPIARTKRARGRAGRSKRGDGSTTDTAKPPPPPEPPPPTPGGSGTAAKVQASDAAQQHYVQGNVYLKQKKVTLAIDELKKSIKQDPRNGLAYRSLGVAYYMLGRERSAMEAYSRFVVLSPTHKDVPKVKGIIAEYNARK